MAAGRARESWRAARVVCADRRLRGAVLGYAAAITAEWMFTVALAVVAFRDGGAAAAPALIALLDAPRAMVVIGLFLPCVAAAAWRPFSALDQRLGVRDDIIAVLRSAPILRQLPVPSIEYLAGHAASAAVADGTVIVRQGDPGDRFFVIAHGLVDVVGDGVHLRTMGAGIVR